MEEKKKDTGFVVKDKRHFGESVGRSAAGGN